MAITLDRSKTPGVVGILFGAVLSVALGALLAGVHLASLPVEVVKTMPKEPVAGTRYLVLGQDGRSAAKTWQRQAESLALGGATASFTEADLNAWAAANFEEVEVNKAEQANKVTVIAGTPNFRVTEAGLQVALVNTLNVFGSETPLVLSATGGFAKGAGGWRYAPAEMTIGALPLHRVPVLMPLVIARFTGGLNGPENLAKVMGTATDIAVRDGALTIVMP